MSTIQVGGVHASKFASPGMSFDISGATEAAAGLDLIKRMPALAQKRAILTLKQKILTEANRDIRKQYNIKQGRVAKDLRVSIGANRLRLTGYFRGIGLRNFAARPTSKGVSYAVFRTQRKLREGAFFVGLFRGRGGTGNEHVAKRGAPKKVMTAGSYVGKLRAPLITQYGPTVAQMLRKGNRPERLANFAMGVLAKEATRLMKASLSSN